MQESPLVPPPPPGYRCKCTSPSPGTLLMFFAMLLPVLAAVLSAMGFRGRDVLLGIDLGTTYSSIALRRPSGIVVAEGSGGRLGTPSVVAISPAGTWVVGGAAEAVLALQPSWGAVDSKRVIGRRLGDPMCVSEGARHAGRLVEHPTARRVHASGKAVRTAKQRAHCATGPEACWADVAFALAVPPGLPPGQAARLAAHACLDPGSLSQDAQLLLLTPQAAACLVVAELLAAAERALGHGARKAMAATPTDFDAAQRSATLEALERAGLAVSRLLHEPTAAAIAYGLHKAPGVHTVLVYDFGGGTLDVSVLFASLGSFTVIGTAGDNGLGGEDVDDCLAGLLLASSASAAQCQPLALSAEAERVKKALSGNGGEGALLEVPWACPLPGAAAGAASGTVTAQAFEATCGGLFDRAMAPVREALQGASLRVEEVDEVVLVGGSTRLPAVRQRLQQFFGGKQLRTSVDPDLAVAIGAAASGD